MDQKKCSVGRISGYQLSKSAAQEREEMAILIPPETKYSNKIDLGCGSAGVEYYWNEQQQ